MTGTFVSYKRWSVALFLFLSAVLGVLGMNFPANAACTNPSPIPTGFAAPCPVWSPSAQSVTQSQTLTLSATPQAGTDYILTTAYISNGTAWNPYTLSGNNAVPNYSSALASLTLTSSQLSALSLGTHYTVVWDWLWDATGVEGKLCLRKDPAAVGVVGTVNRRFKVLWENRSLVFPQNRQFPQCFSPA
jgi:hypothetical protein